MAKIIKMECYESSGPLADTLRIVAGTTFYLRAATCSRHLASHEQESILDTAHKARYVDNGEQTIIPVVFLLPEQLDELKQVVRQLHSKQRIIIFWQKNIFERLGAMRRMLSELGFEDINLAYLLPNALNPSHLVMTEGVAIRLFYRARAGKFLLRQIIYKMNVMKYFEKSIICWAKVS